MAVDIAMFGRGVGNVPILTCCRSPTLSASAKRSSKTHFTAVDDLRRIGRRCRRRAISAKRLLWLRAVLHLYLYFHKSIPLQKPER
ncbi:hypothetical protein KCP73_17875 [Salmonella enterica subsp. enterica]|nr:hypothetical protein KCP73_17875 [Salmonella enterica subsp. enterica]